MVETEVIGGNIWSKVAEKFLIGLGTAIGGIFLTYSIEFLQTGDFTGLPTWFIASIPFLTAVLAAAQNAWAHRQKVVEVTE